MKFIFLGILTALYSYFHSCCFWVCIFIKNCSQRGFEHKYAESKFLKQALICISYKILYVYVNLLIVPFPVVNLEIDDYFF